jgi:hypothetical protein
LLAIVNEYAADWVDESKRQTAFQVISALEEVRTENRTRTIYRSQEICHTYSFRKSSLSIYLSICRSGPLSRSFFLFRFGAITHMPWK